MLAADFISKWRASDLTERSAAQSHFRDLGDLLGEQAPSDADPKGEWYAFEKGATKTTGGEGWADVRKPRLFRLGVQEQGQGPEAVLRTTPASNFATTPWRWASRWIRRCNIS